MHTNQTFIFNEITIKANSFLYKMIRHIIGALFEVFKQKQSIEKMIKMIEENKKQYGYQLAQAKGLCLQSVEY